MEKTFASLKKFNIFMGCLHAIQGILMLALSTDFTLPVTSAFLEFDPIKQQLVPVIENVFDLSIGPLVAIFLFLSAIAHFSISIIPKINRWYVNNLKKGMNLARWIEYSLSSSLMIVVVAMLAGMYDGLSLVLLFFLNAMMILFGWVMEVHNQTTAKTNWLSYIFGCIAGIVPWVVIGFYLFGAGSEFGDAPSFVYWIYLSIFLFFNVFAINMILQYQKIGRWKNYLYGEYMYIILSLVAKSLLAWQVWAGTLRPV
ncbi:heliorhodopsin HeR [Patescibacteria group bacterium]